MSVENESVSLSRLLLAKAIKTPDSEEQDAEPWTKSILFHQSHISPSMRQALVSRTKNNPSRHINQRPMSPSQTRKQSSRRIIDQQQQPRSPIKTYIPMDSDIESENEYDSSSEDEVKSEGIISRPASELSDDSVKTPSTTSGSPRMMTYPAYYMQQLYMYQQQQCFLQMQYQQAVLATQQQWMMLPREQVHHIRSSKQSPKVKTRMYP
ncbi:hypothetical protein BC941DRAFT_441773 [Chlamydoabsidia padenii]|nr:hypothetical protein BC941DRAFT_441773 [Chlamydoabsidia padenii]